MSLGSLIFFAVLIAAVVVAIQHLWKERREGRSLGRLDSGADFIFPDFGAPNDVVNSHSAHHVSSHHGTGDCGGLDHGGFHDGGHGGFDCGGGHH